MPLQTPPIMQNVRWAFMLITMIGLFGMSQQWSFIATALAQPGGDGEAPDATPSDTPADSGEDDPSAGATATKASSEPGRTLLQSLMESRWIGLLLFLLSIASVGLIVEHSLTIRKGILMPDELIAELDELMQAGKLAEAHQVCQDPTNICLFSNVVLAGLDRFQGSEYGFAEYKAAVEEAGEDQTGALYRKTDVLGVIGAIAPMLGLTGTVLGMITAFNTIASTQGNAKPHELAGGISQALVTTLMGLMVAIPCMVAFSYFRNRIDSIVAEAGKRVEQVLMPLGRRK
jgi:biopolymer transport protein ExbB